MASEHRWSCLTILTSITLSEVIRKYEFNMTAIYYDDISAFSERSRFRSCPKLWETVRNCQKLFEAALSVGVNLNACILVFAFATNGPAISKLPPESEALFPIGSCARIILKAAKGFSAGESQPMFRSRIGVREHCSIFPNMEKPQIP